MQLQKQKRGLYKTYSSTVQYDIGKYACQNGVTVVATYFSVSVISTNEKILSSAIVIITR